MIFKCKMCGGDVTPIKDTNTGKCQFCKSVMTFPTYDDDKIIDALQSVASLEAHYLLATSIIAHGGQT